MSLKTRIQGRVIEVGWEPNSTHTNRHYVLIKVKLGSQRQKAVAHEKVKLLQKRLLGKKVVIFPDE